MAEPAEFLTPQECAQVDGALLGAREKFSARVAIYALRSLKAIAQEANQPISALRTHQIVDWINQDPSLQASGDSSFRAFFAQLVDSARRPLTQAADRFGQPIEALEIAQVIQWFEQVAKQNLEAPPSEG
jgi:hypothetical protein